MRGSYGGGMFWRLGAIAMVVVAVVAAVSAGSATAATAPGAVGVRTQSFVDRTRSTPADVVAGITPANERRLPTTIFYPARGKAAVDGEPVPGARPKRGPFPVVLFAGGAPGSPENYAPLLQEWAAAGYVVVAPTFPVSSYAGPDDVAYTDLPEQSGDLRFVLRRVLKLDPETAGIPELDADRIAVAGHSFGGQTALSLIAKCCRDSRVDVAMSLAGVTDADDGPPLQKLRGPVLFVHARNDRAVPYQFALDTCVTVGGWKRMLSVDEIRGIRAHIEPYLGDGEYADVVRPATIDFLDGYLGGDAGARRRLARVGGDADWADLTRCRAGATAGR
jgi:dienelactone hydrolase